MTKHSPNALSRGHGGNWVSKWCYILLVASALGAGHATADGHTELDRRQAKYAAWTGLPGDSVWSISVKGGLTSPDIHISLYYEDPEGRFADALAKVPNRLCSEPDVTRTDENTVLIEAKEGKLGSTLANAQPDLRRLDVHCRVTGN